MTTALFETGTGSGLSLGSSAALRDTARQKKIAGRNFFIEEILAAGQG
jgi:hypothetical protein